MRSHGKRLCMLADWKGWLANTAYNSPLDEEVNYYRCAEGCSYNYCLGALCNTELIRVASIDKR